MLKHIYRTFSQADRYLALQLALAALTLWLYWPSTTHAFVNFDDPGYVSNNPHVTKGLSLKSFHWAFTQLHGNMSYWHPLTWLSHMLDCELFGLNARLHHLTSVWLHVLNSLLVFALLKRATGRIWESAAVAALFAWHPMHVESVAWISERKDLLCAMFWILCMINYCAYTTTWKVSRFVLSIICFGFSLLAKPMSVTLPCVLLVMDYWPLGRMSGSKPAFRLLILEKTPFFLLSMAHSCVTFIAQKELGAMAPLSGLPIEMRLANAAYSYVCYLWKAVMPFGLSVQYTYPNIGLVQPLAAVAALGLVTLSLYRARKSHPHWLAGWLWFLGTLVPVIGIVQVGAQAMADRYTYVPYLGLFMGLVFGIRPLIAGISRSRLIWSTVAVLFVFLILCSRMQLAYWADTRSLWTRVVTENPQNESGFVNLGNLLKAQGRHVEAIQLYDSAIAANPREGNAFLQKGLTLMWLGNLNEGLDLFEHGVVLSERSSSTGALHEALKEASRIFCSHLTRTLRDGNKALQFAQAAGKFRSQNDAYLDLDFLQTLAAAYAAAQRFAEAQKTAQEALRLAQRSGAFGAQPAINESLVAFREREILANVGGERRHGKDL